MRGFTLIELMIVIAVIGIIAAIAIPQFANYRQKSIDSIALSDVKNIMLAEESEYVLNQSYVSVPPDVGPAWLFGHTRFVSKNIGFRINTNANNTQYAIFAGHLESDKEYAADTQGQLLKKTQPNAGTVAQTEVGTDLSGWGGSSL